MRLWHERPYAGDAAGSDLGRLISFATGYEARFIV